MSSKLEPVIWLRVLVTLAYMKGRTDVRTENDVMAILPNGLSGVLTIYTGKPEIPVGRSNGSRHSVWEASENLGFDLW